MGIDIVRRLAHDPKSVPEARHSLAPLEHTLDRRTFDALRLLVTELVANSVRHATGVAHDHIELCVSASGARVRVEVANSGPGFTPPPRSAEPDTSGLGLHLIETLSDRWGTKRDERMRVWFELVDSGT